MSDGLEAMTHENDGGQCWCGPKCGPVAYAPVEQTEPECPRCADPIPGMPAHEPSRRCHYRPRYVAHCTCRACF